MTRDEFFAADIITRLEMAQAAIAGGADSLGVLAYDPIVWEDDGTGIHVSDVIRDAVIAIRRLRGEQPA
jgi:hypothetical protein